MHARSIIALTAIILGLSASLATAQPQERRDSEQRQQAPSREARQPARQAGAQRAQDNRQAAAKPAPQSDRGRGAGTEQRFHKGDRLPADQRSKQYVVDDWRGHNLSAPPRGHRWVQVGGDYVLIAVATGIITQLILSR